jgi:hypothetical protein
MENNVGMNGIYKVTELSSSPSSVTTIISPRDNIENDVIETSSSIDIQSQLQLSTDTNVDSSSTVSNLCFFGKFYPFLFFRNRIE